MGNFYDWKLLKQDVAKNQDEILNYLLETRGFTTAKEKADFINNNYEINDPFLMRGMKEAVKRIREAILNKEKIIIYGDYDCDGVTSTTILIKTLKKLGADVNYFIPNRVTHGYGPNIEVYKKIIKSKYKLVIAVDTGITGIEEAKMLKDACVDYIIVDHHEPKEILPEALAIINPKVDLETYGFKEFCAAGLAFKVSHALLGKIDSEILEIATVGTIADMVPLLEENRKIVTLGLRQLGDSKNKAFKKIVGNNTEIDTDFIGFRVSPLINAVGRLDDAKKSVAFLLEENDVTSNKHLECIKLLYEASKKKTIEGFEIAKKKVEEYNLEEKAVIVVESSKFSKGIVGILANRLMDYYNKPALVLVNNKKYGTFSGSGRSRSGFNLYENVKKCESMLGHFGGHAYELGLSLTKAQLEPFKKEINKIASIQKIKFYLDIDCKMPLELCDIKAVEKIKKLEPFGQGNKRPLFLFENIIVKSLAKTKTGEHIRIIIDGTDTSILAFNMAEHLINAQLARQTKIDVVGTLQYNNYTKKLEIILVDFEILKQ